MKSQQGVVRTLRIFLLLLALVAVAGEAWLAARRSTDWDAPLWVSVYPLNADSRPRTSAYIANLSGDEFEPLEAYFKAQAESYGLPLEQPFVFHLAGEIAQPPPTLAGDHPLQVMWWSLKLRFWAWRVTGNPGDPPADIRIFVNYHDPEASRRLEHSVGLRKGLIGVVNAFAAADYAGQNRVVIAHELLHTLGATDKYDPATNRPLFPHGYAEPERRPPLPQRRAELMAGRVPLAPDVYEQPGTLRRTTIGELTAYEINWPADPPSVQVE